jgi:hypothetical protein
MANSTVPFGIQDSRFVDWAGRPVWKTPDECPYSYDAYVIWRKDDSTMRVGHTSYSDRLLQWDYDKHNKLCMKHFGNEGQMWDGREPCKVEAFLKDYHGEPGLGLVGIMKGCNVSNGFPYWLFLYDV